ncbi:hypothetical protein N7462_000361 [Penicillium macrosclerotiorum]|uniref:uncharacterized protein n=1 Tax=Penicillium macrosclerotiorum TaxID=303699 RepID=UPI0025466926|nr:uncharacterized protein N7462_000361 [Penicillium macrosclerotiorum]KAJ5698356.1 hypothetical protein N7462_000361 [Penicillium macrosclerotiorum]
MPVISVFASEVSQLRVRFASIIVDNVAVARINAVICVKIIQCSLIGKAYSTDALGICISLKEFFIGNTMPDIATNIAIVSLAAHLALAWGLYVIRT